MELNSFKKILVPVRLDIDSTAAFKQALHFRKKFKAKVSLLHVVQKKGELTNMLQPKLESSLQGIGMVHLIRFAKMHFRGRIPNDIKLRVEVGDYVNIISEIANSEDFNLVVINRTNNITGLIKKYNKTVNRMIGKLKCPLISVNTKWTSNGVKSILIPIDISEQSDDLVNWAIVLAKTFKAKIKVLLASTLNIDTKNSFAYEKSLLIKSAIKKEGINCSIIIVQDDNIERSKALVEGVKKIQADMILIQEFQNLMLSNTQNKRLLSEFIQNSSHPIFSLGTNHSALVKELLSVNKSQIYNSENLTGKLII
ncbi:universal stress protein [Marinifilum sp.]|uniref:universal stress protein n=1 Tax=Marinifilum sp. TaxID=2033137 RepID=UPI003BAA35D8